VVIEIKSPTISQQMAHTLKHFEQLEEEEWNMEPLDARIKTAEESRIVDQVRVVPLVGLGPRVKFDF